MGGGCSNKPTSLYRVLEGPGPHQVRGPWRKQLVPGDPEPRVRTAPVDKNSASDRTACARMKALKVVLLVLLLSGQSGSSWAQEKDGDVDVGPESYGYDDDYEEEEEEEINMVPESRDKEHLQCYTCQSLHRGESCNQTQSCHHSKTFCTTFISHGNTDNGLLTTYSMWCTDTCQPITKMISGTQLTQICCQSTLCNIPPWQSPQVQDSLDVGVRHPQGGRVAKPKSGGASLPPGWPKFCNTALLLSLLTSLWASGA